MNNYTTIKELRESLKAFQVAFSDIDIKCCSLSPDMEDEIFFSDTNKAYPFEKDLTEQFYAVCEWINTVNDKLNEIEGRVNNED